MRAFIVLCSVVSLAFGSPFTPCSPPAGQIAKVDVDGCSNDVSRCTLHKGTTSKLSINFQSAVDAKAIKVKVYGIIDDLPVPYPLAHSDGCDSSGITCPVKNQTLNTYSNSLPVHRYYPSVDLTVKWTLINENKEQLLCVLIPVSVQ